jgi:hypothetical protein
MARIRLASFSISPGGLDTTGWSPGAGIRFHVSGGRIFPDSSCVAFQQSLHHIASFDDSRTPHLKQKPGPMSMMQ